MGSELVERLIEELKVAAMPFAAKRSNMRNWLVGNAELRKRAATTLSAQEEQIDRLTKALTEIMESEQTYVGVPYGKPPRDLPPAKIARAALEGSKRDG